MPVLVRNRQSGPTVFTDPVSKAHVEWQGAGDPSGNDVQYVPDAFVDNIDFMKAVNRGILSVEEASDEIKQALAKQVSAFQARQTAAEVATKESLEAVQDNEILSVPCVGPSARGAGECGDAVPIRANKRDETPPLCSQHAHLAGEYISEQYEFDNNTGKPKVRWIRTAVG